MTPQFPIGAPGRMNSRECTLRQRRSAELGNQVDPIFKQPAKQKSLAHRLSCPAAEAFPHGWVLENLNDTFRSLVHGIDKKSVLPVHDLASDAADIPPDHDSTLPHRFGNGQTKPFAN